MQTTDTNRKKAIGDPKARLHPFDNAVKASRKREDAAGKLHVEPPGS
jgi:hypothetical protein